MSLLELVVMITPPRNKGLTHSREASQKCGFRALKQVVNVVTSCVCCLVFVWFFFCGFFFFCPFFLACFCGTKLRMGERTTGALHTETLRCQRRGVLFQPAPSPL